MRPFSEFEKKMISKIAAITLEDSNLGDLIANAILENRVIEIEEGKRMIVLWYLKTDENAVIELFELISLLNYLEKNYLIFIHSNPERPIGRERFITNNVDQQYFDNRINDFERQPIQTDIFDRIIKYIRSFLVCGTELKALVKNDFKSQEQIAHEKEMEEAKRQTRISRVSLCVAFLALVLSFLSPLIFSTRINKQQINTINTVNQAQVDNLIEIKNYITTSIDSLLNQAHTPDYDTPQVKVRSVK